MEPNQAEPRGWLPWTPPRRSRSPVVPGPRLGAPSHARTRLVLEAGLWPAALVCQPALPHLWRPRVSGEVACCRGRGGFTHLSFAVTDCVLTGSCSSCLSAEDLFEFWLLAGQTGAGCEGPNGQDEVSASLGDTLEVAGAPGGVWRETGRPGRLRKRRLERAVRAGRILRADGEPEGKGGRWGLVHLHGFTFCHRRDVTHRLGAVSCELSLGPTVLSRT